MSAESLVKSGLSQDSLATNRTESRNGSHGPALGATRSGYGESTKGMHWLDYNRSLVIKPTTSSEREEKVKKRKPPKHVEQYVRYGLTYCMTFGITQAALHHANLEEPSKEEDYLTHTLLKFKPEDSKIQQPFHFKSFAPKVFKKLRRTFNVDDESYLGSLMMADVVHFQTSSKSGGFFFFTNDGKYLIKTATKKELDFFLKKLCKDYYNHILQFAETSLLVRFMGFYELEAPHVKKIGFSTTRFIVMRSVYSESIYHPCHYVYDLKGSRNGRSAKPGEHVHKDNDIVKEDRKFYIGNEEERGAFAAQINSDVQWLADHNIMDYSLLVGIHDESAHKRQLPSATSFVLNFRSGIFEEMDLEDDEDDDEEERRPEENLSKYAMIKVPGETYYMAIIDILTPYDANKQLEHVWKSTIQRKKEPSAVPPARYATRFSEFILKRISHESSREEAHI